jgi:hypothetical protein
MASIKKTKVAFDLLEVIDPEDATPHPVMGRLVTARGILKMASCTAFHHADEASRTASRVMVDRFLPKATEHGFDKAAAYLQLYAAKVPPVKRARELSNEVVGLLSLSEQAEILDMGVSS